MTKDMRKSYNLPDPFMEEIYNDIDANPISLKDEVEQHSYSYYAEKNPTQLGRNTLSLKKKLRVS